MFDLRLHSCTSSTIQATVRSVRAGVADTHVHARVRGTRGFTLAEWWLWNQWRNDQEQQGKVYKRHVGESHRSNASHWVRGCHRKHQVCHCCTEAVLG